MLIEVMRMWERKREKPYDSLHVVEVAITKPGSWPWSRAQTTERRFVIEGLDRATEKYAFNGYCLTIIDELSGARYSNADTIAVRIISFLAHRHNDAQLERERTAMKGTDVEVWRSPKLASIDEPQDAPGTNTVRVGPHR